MSALRTAVDEVLAQAARIDQDWAELIREIGSNQCPPAKAWEADDDARRELAYAATAVLRDLLSMATKGEDVNAALRPDAPELIVGICPDGAEEYVIDYPSPFGSRYDRAVYLQPEESFTACPVCWRVNGGVTEVDRSERWNRGRFEEVQPDTRTVIRGADRAHEANPLAGLPALTVHNGSHGDYETDRYQCTDCGAAIALPGWVEVTWL